MHLGYPILKRGVEKNYNFKQKTNNFLHNVSTRHRSSLGGCRGVIFIPETSRRNFISLTSLSNVQHCFEGRSAWFLRVFVGPLVQTLRDQRHCNIEKTLPVSGKPDCHFHVSHVSLFLSFAHSIPSSKSKSRKK